MEVPLEKCGTPVNQTLIKKQDSSFWREKDEKVSILAKAIQDQS